ncbi:hypothetical protein GE09DRAFT_1147697 [Coniochaeta sp. 2T2.1]|nr:hypothetical protein GE09DRAFT_1147697 [Coniochaeta sp. 2T2.1]
MSASMTADCISPCSVGISLALLMHALLRLLCHSACQKGPCINMPGSGSELARAAVLVMIETDMQTCRRYAADIRMERLHDGILTDMQRIRSCADNGYESARLLEPR